LEVDLGSRIGLIVALTLGAPIFHADAQQSNAPYHATMPDHRVQCLEILELERLRIDPQNGNVTFYPQDSELYVDYTADIWWLQGFLAGQQVDNPYHAPQLATWLFSYCRANPTKTLYKAALELSHLLGSNPK
jgi:hypothetical protein